MSDISNLEQMGRELKCPICLSLLKSAVSLTCNHVFCNLCIEKSMKATSDCPVCKVPYRRREIRPAPHMDNLVRIYKSMEVASGVNIFVSQVAPTNKVSADKDQLDGVKTCVEEENIAAATSAAEPPKRCKRKASNKFSNSCDRRTNSEKPSFPTKKRVQVPQYPYSETPTCPVNSERETADAADVENQERSEFIKEKPVISKNGEPVFSPFFWLREDEENIEKSSQHTDVDHGMYTPPEVPSFSDIKDSDDNHPSKLTPDKGTCILSSDVDFFDSEMFEWTQRACSPELYSSPLKLQIEGNDEHNMPAEKSEAFPPDMTINVAEGGKNRENITNEKGTERVARNFSSEIDPGNKTQEVKKSIKRARKPTKSTWGNRVKKSMHEAPGKETDCNLPDNFDNNFDTLNIKDKLNEDIKYLDAGATETSPDNITTGGAGAGSVPRHNRTRYADLPTSQDQTECDEGILILNEKSKGSKKTITRQQRYCARPKTTKSKPLLDVVTYEYHVESAANSSHKSSLTVKNNTTDLNNITRNCEVNNKKKTSKKMVEFYEDSKSKDISGSASQIHSAAKKSQTSLEVLESPASGVQDDSSRTDKVLDHLVLRKCGNSKTQCAFCHSPEESEASGAMVHYLKGKLVDKYHDGRSDVIHAHKKCIEWARNVYFEDDNVINLEAELARSRRIKCCFCAIKGAALGCYEKKCQRSFHVPCAKLTPDCRWDYDHFVALCPLHASSKLPHEMHGFQDKKMRCVPKRSLQIHKPKVTVQLESGQDLLWKTQKKTKDVIICCSALTNEEKGMVSEFKRLSGVTILKNWDSSVTHIVASTDENGACRRTFKFLMGVLEGKWILNIEWIKDCLNSRELVGEQLYEIEVDSHGIRNGPRLGRFRLVNKQPKLFAGSKFYLMGDFSLSYKGYLRDLVVAAGGTVLNRKPILGDQVNLSTVSSFPATFIIYSIELPDKCMASKRNSTISRRKADAEALASYTGAVAVSNSWILNSIAGCKLQSLSA